MLDLLSKISFSGPVPNYTSKSFLVNEQNEQNFKVAKKGHFSNREDNFYSFWNQWVKKIIVVFSKISE